MANKRVTRYVVVEFGAVLAVFELKKNAEEYVKHLGYGDIDTIRFRTPEVK